MPVSESHVDLFLNLFKGREDIYARRWVKGDDSGYMPAYDVNWGEFEKHKAQGGSFKNYKHKKPAPLTRAVIKHHLAGHETVGIYPLLEDNTSWFIAADFDGDHWMKEGTDLLNSCEKHGLPACLERSISGNGGHVWIFFQEPCPAWKSRQVVFHLLREADILSDFDMDTSFDRLFPNQDMHSGDGFGNLIALPLNKKWITQGNTCFIEPATGEPFVDQWKFLEQIERTTTSRLDQVYRSIRSTANHTSEGNNQPQIKLKIIIKDQIRLSKNKLDPDFVSFLRDKLNFLNSDYLVKKNLGRSTFQTEKYFKLIGEEDDKINIPRGFLPDLISYCKEKGYSYNIVDHRQKSAPVVFNSGIKLHPYQEEAIEPANSSDFGVFVAPPGSGKTIMGLEIIARKKQPALIVVHRKQLFDQWVERIQSFLSIPKKEIGRISGSQKKAGKRITVGMIQSLHRAEDNDGIPDAFGTIIVDECHHIPAKTFRETITRFHSYYLYGLTATPMRKNNDENLIYVFIGHILSEIKSDFLDDKKAKTIQINVRNTDLRAPFDYRIDNYETLSRILVYDTARNKIILDDLTGVIKQKKSILVLTERKAHIDVLNLYLKDRFETIALSGDDSNRSQDSKIKQIKAGHFQIVLTTGQFFGEGIDIDRFDCLFLVYPFAFKGKLIQYIGRITRSDKLPVIYDYRDRHINYFEKLFKKRNAFYNEIRKANQLTLEL